LKIGIIHFYNRSFPPEIRLEKQSIALIEAGYDVRVLSQKMHPSETDFEILSNNYSVERIKVGKQSLLSKFNFNRKEYVEGLQNFISSYEPDILHVHDFHTIPIVVKTVKGKIPIIADLHENMPAAWKAYRANFNIVKKTIHAIVYNYHIWRYYERKYLPECAAILVTVPEAKNVLIQLGINSNIIHPISNTEDETTFPVSKQNFNKKLITKYDNEWILLYVGGLGPHRGLETTLRSVPHVNNHIENFKLLIVGAKDFEKDAIVKLANNLKIAPHVEVINWVPFSEIFSYIKLSSVCIVPHDDYEHTQTTIPHKLFQYMIMGKPVLVSNCRPLKRVIDDTKSGLVFTANDPRDLAKKLIQLNQNPEELEQMSKNSIIAANGKYSWKIEKNKLLELYSSLRNIN
jgi:glycosyltransferase involved in cell wall biosynthesis